MHHAQRFLSFEISNNGIISTFHEGVFKVKRQFDCKSQMFSKHYLTLIKNAETLLLLLLNCCYIVNSF